MFCFLNRLRSLWHSQVRTALSCRSGQVAVVLIVVIAVGLIFFAATINLTTVSQFKTLTMKAASVSASSTASMIASYGQKEYIETMGGRLKKCKSFGGGFFGILTIIVMIVIAVFAPEILGAMTGVTPTLQAVTALQAAAVIGATMEAASMVVNSRIDPGISSAWNKMQNANLSMTGQVVERGVQTALQAAVTDDVEIPDLYDLDGDGLFGYGPTSGDVPSPTIAPNDTVSRFAYYNTKRYLGLKASDVTAVRDFLNALHQLVLPGVDNWGLWDPVYYPKYLDTGPQADPNHPCFLSSSPQGIDNPNRPAECDSCCDVFESGTDAMGNPIPIPSECDPATGATQLGKRSTCAARSPFRAIGHDYPYVYDFSYEDSTNTFMSFREQLGRDDEHHLYNVNPANPNWHSTPVAGGQTLSTAPPGFYLKDVVGYYQNPPFAAAVVNSPDEWVSAGPPPSPKLFPFLYKMTDWGVFLADPSFDYNDSGNNYHCHWCDASVGNTCNADYPASYPEIPRPTIPNPSNLSQGKCVNNVNRPGAGLNDPPWVADRVAGISGLAVADNMCAISLTNVSPDLSAYVGGWKRGADRYCSNRSDSLYYLDCPKHGGAIDENLECGETGAGAASMWPDDMIDDIIYGLPGLYDFERTIHGLRGNQDAGLGVLTQTLPDWYGLVVPGETTVEGIADWIEPPCPDPSSCQGSYTKLARPGTLWVWREQLRWLNNKIQTWLLTPFASRTLMGPDAAWCVPSFNAGNGSAPPGEVATFDSNANGVRGDIADVIACLRWNEKDPRTYQNNFPSPAVGNEQKFLRCYNNCSQDTCTNLPRSLVTDFYNGTLYRSGQPANVFDPGNTADRTAFQNCLQTQTLPTNSTNIAQCQTRCGALPSGAPYNLPGFVAPALTNIASIESWCSGSNAGNLASLCNPARMPGNAQLNCAVNKNLCICSWAGSCAGFASCTLDVGFRDAVINASVAAGGSCSDSDYLNVMQRSANEAALQVEKFKKRADFLEGRYDEAIALSNDRATIDSSKPDGILTTGIRKLTEFLDNDTPNNLTDSPVERFIKARIDSDQYTNDSGDLPAFGIYVWQDPDDEKLNPGGQQRWGDAYGNWHAVKVEVRIPRRCAGDCVARDWPKVFSKTKKPGILKKGKICYELKNLVGRTKARVIRYDQDKDLRGLRFFGGASIWEDRMSHPLTGQSGPTGIRSACGNEIDSDMTHWLAETSGNRHRLGAAFMLNKVPKPSSTVRSTSEIQYADCWTKVHQDLLAHGIKSEACAEYYFAPMNATQGQGGFRLKFVPCDNW